jgi:hypothetical protein
MPDREIRRRGIARGGDNSRELCTPRLVAAATVAEAIDVRPATGIFMRSISLMMMLLSDGF